MLSACWLIGAYFLAVSSHKRGRLNTSVYGITIIYILHEFDIKTSTFLEAQTGYCCIHRVKQTIVHMILSRSVHQITYGDVIKAFC